MKQYFMKDSKSLLIFVLAVCVFGIINTEMGVIGILPDLADHFDVNVSTVGLLLSLFALAIAGPTLPLVFSRFNRKKVMLLVLLFFIVGNIISIFTTNFTVALIVRVITAFFHPVYVSIALSVAAASVTVQEGLSYGSQLKILMQGIMKLLSCLKLSIRLYKLQWQEE